MPEPVEVVILEHWPSATIARALSAPAVKAISPPQPSIRKLDVRRLLNRTIEVRRRDQLAKVGVALVSLASRPASRSSFAPDLGARDPDTRQ
jgi:hypothetical protein